MMAHVPNCHVSIMFYCSFVSLIFHDFIRDDTHITSMKTVQFSRPPIPVVHIRPKHFHPLDLGRPISNEPSPLPTLQMKTNGLKEKIIQGWLFYFIRSFFQIGFRSQYQLINFVWLSFDFFSFT